ncbi:hypothetical protein AVEN_60955-1 [Araneus ventricosus]|uniref:DUF5641 domain-containing protein n=1 Tax=Araneus ventricosus TaxID=182803 RepID=A0A4Y2DBM2_ARAVE|nr:hypothetical protein AVEN_60955-1 [Araneus ventricosus]
MGIGRNFKGSNHALNKVDWNKTNDDTSVSRLQWKFIPPSSAWWGGFWERLIGLLKTILRKILGKASLRYEELSTILCDCENFINSRPITYISEDLELEPLKPAMFLRDIQESGIPDLDQIDSTSLQKRFLYRLKLREDLRKRFRSEYLGHLRIYAKGSRNRHTFCVGDIVLIESTAKRINWSLGKVVQLIEGKDGVLRLVKIRTKQGELLRPIQRLYTLEVSSPNDGDLRKLIEGPTICEKSECNISSDPSSQTPESGLQYLTLGRKCRPRLSLTGQSLWSNSTCSSSPGPLEHLFPEF